ncbi:PAAR-like protein [Cytophaga aurantiaca]|uniref:PAAR-like protein n=1 Tax=Cytophaga aurantiaca TaxID=29530 RepID=UPI00037E5248|nr:PAAR-like protein [Cytophaga aurantiaca]
MGWFKTIISTIAAFFFSPQSLLPAKPSAAGDGASDEEKDNMAKLEEETSESKKQAKAKEDQKLVINGAKIQCTLCTNPLGTLMVTYNTPSLQGMPIATAKDKDKPNLLFMGTCMKSPNAASPCAAVIQTGEWKSTGSFKVQNQSPLLLKSTNTCTYGGVDIKVTDSGQRNTFAYDAPTEIEHDVEEYIDITLGAFFDGTLNNKTNTEQREANTETFKKYSKDKSNSYYNSYSNVARLWDFYNKTNSVYIEGIGTEDLKDDNTNGYAFGAGETGVRGKVKKGCEKIFEKTQKLAPKGKINTLTFDVFGFSRGATASRNFTYEVTKTAYKPTQRYIQGGRYSQGRYEKKDSFGNVTQLDLMPMHGHLGLLFQQNGYIVKNIRIRFLGIFDTVSSYHEGSGTLGNAATYDFTNDVEELHLESIYHADKIIHFTAEDEHRVNFALTKIKTTPVEYNSDPKKKIAIEKSLPGVHCDVGGAYIDGDVEIVKQIDYEAFGTEELEKERNRLIAEGWYKREQLEIIKHNTKTNWLKGTRKLYNTYSFIPLHFMCEFAINHKKSLPFDQGELEKRYSLKKLDAETNKKVTDELLIKIKERLHNYVFKNGPPIELKNLYVLSQQYKDSKIPDQRYADYLREQQEHYELLQLRNEYFHWSANYKGFGMEPNMKDGKRKRVHYPN